MSEFAPGSQTVLDERAELRDSDDHERFSHYVPTKKLEKAKLTGTPVIALCGKVWVPSRNPDKYPVCPGYEEIWQSMKSEDPGK